MRCRCCLFDLSDDSARCPVCGFPVNSSSTAGIDTVARGFRQKRLNGITIAVRMYQYKHNDYGELAEYSSEYVTVAVAPSLEFHKVQWFGRKFNPPKVNRDIVLETKLSYPDRQISKTVSARIDKPLACSRLGVYLDDGLTLCFAVGTKDNYVLSERIGLMKNSVHKNGLSAGTRQAGKA